MKLTGGTVAVLGLHWQVNVIEPQGVFGPLLAEPVRRSGVVDRAVQFHDEVREANVPVYFTRFVVPDGGGQLVANTEFMRHVCERQEEFRPDSTGAGLIESMRHQVDVTRVVDNQKLSGMAGNDLADRLRADGVDTILLTGVATNLTVEQTARHATDLGFFVVPVMDCIAAATPEVHEASSANLNLVTAAMMTAGDVCRSLR